MITTDYTKVNPDTFKAVQNEPQHKDEILKFLTDHGIRANYLENGTIQLDWFGASEFPIEIPVHGFNLRFPEETEIPPGDYIRLKMTKHGNYTAHHYKKKNFEKRYMKA